MISEPIRWALQDAPVDDPAARHVLLVLACHAKPDGSGARPTLKATAAETGLHRATVIRARNQLEEAGIITRTGTIRRATVWQLELGRVAERDPSDPGEGSHSATLKGRTARPSHSATRRTARPGTNNNGNGNNGTSQTAAEGPPWVSRPTAVGGRG